MSKLPFGARAAEWAGWLTLIGPGDLLPVISNPGATISPQSKLRALGKTPSRYNRARQAAGIADWTSQVSSEEQVRGWLREPDYGICVQTRLVRAIDIDVPDRALSQPIMELVTKRLGTTDSVRWRADSGKMLVALTVTGEIAKRVVRVEGGIVELLGNGQQFVAAGTHPDGERYQWGTAQPAPSELPSLTLDQLDELWSDIELLFGAPDASGGPAGGNRAPAAVIRRGKNSEVSDDAVSKFIRGTDWFRGDDQRGRVFLHCPWKGGHSGDSGETETCYLVGGANGVEQGHFRCLHASCGLRTDADFLAELGWSIDGFANLDGDRGGSVAGLDGDDRSTASPAPGVGVGAPDGGQHIQVVPTSEGSGHAEAVASLPLDRQLLALAGQPAGVMPPLDRKNSGEVKSRISNIVALLQRPDIMGFALAFDEFTGQIVFGTPAKDGGGWRKFGDADYGRVIMRLTQLMVEEVGADMIRRAVLTATDGLRFDSAANWVRERAAAWDGVSRIESFYPYYMRSEDTPYSRALGRYQWTAMAGRLLVPGVQADIAPVWVSPQGHGKTTAVQLLSPSKEQYVKISLSDADDKTARKLRGKVVGELDELRGLHTKEMEAVKSWVTQQADEWVPKYLEFSHIAKRRLIFIGTTNKEEFLADETGNRRWAPIKVGRAQVELLAADRDQLWGEGAARFLGGVTAAAEGAAWGSEGYRGGVDWFETESLARGIHGDHMIPETWTEVIEQWLGVADGITGERPGAAGFLRMSEITQGALKIEPRAVNMAVQFRVGRAMRELGWEKVDKRIGGNSTKVWVKRSM